MTDAPVEMPTWSRRRWGLAIAGVFVLQAALVFLLERHSSNRQTKSIAVPMVQLRENLSLDQFAVTDPTVFVLPHENGFSGEAWLNHLPGLNYQPADWSEPPRPLAFTPASRGANFEEFIAVNPAPPFETIATHEPTRSEPTLYPMEAALAQSTLRIEGPLAERRLLDAPSLRSWESADLLNASVVQLLVNAEGQTISAVLLSPGSAVAKQQEADATALALAKAAQFAPIANGTLTVGTLIFAWQTLPMPATNAPVGIP